MARPARRPMATHTRTPPLESTTSRASDGPVMLERPRAPAFTPRPVPEKLRNSFRMARNHSCPHTFTLPLYSTTAHEHRDLAGLLLSLRLPLLQIRLLHRHLLSAAAPRDTLPFTPVCPPKKIRTRPSAKPGSNLHSTLPRPSSAHAGGAQRASPRWRGG